MVTAQRIWQQAKPHLTRAPARRLPAMLLLSRPVPFCSHNPEE
ncbi:hypothetical protein LHK_02571 [Laribacter hongkongensis HLHK9]|uniref:Uncharacterized protein n=1 Tax=Laribacter hongkongensis (strain HLHK9) TaxID=557598 RepID=C1DC00_LARHH|nr:hypothetical protein LHK_02571 [Laribacter hongkongensis HLHK9]